MRRNFMKGAMLGAMALAGLAGTGQVQSAKLTAATPGNTVEYKATKEEKKASKQKITINDVTGGLDFTPGSMHVGTTPKLYGQWLQNQSWYSMKKGGKKSIMSTRTAKSIGRA